jgi:hypothetical protein
MSRDAYDVVDEWLDHMMDLTQAQREEALGIIERLFCHCGHLSSIKDISKMSVSHSPCDHVEPKFNKISDLGRIDSSGKYHPGRAEVEQAHLRNQAIVMRTRYSE